MEGKKTITVEFIKSLFEVRKLTHFFKDLIWAIIDYKQENENESKSQARGAIEHCHEFIFDILNNHDKSDILIKKSNDEFYDEKIRGVLFLKFGLTKYNDLIAKTRDYYKKVSNEIHAIDPDEFKKSMKTVLGNIIELFLLTVRIWQVDKGNGKFGRIKLETDFQEFFIKNKDAVEVFLDSIFAPQIRDIIFKNKLITTPQIRNSLFLQRYYPFYTFEEFLISRVLDSKDVLPFRSDGPHLIDFEFGNWIFVPDISSLILQRVENRSSVLILGSSGTGKTVITRYLGYLFQKRGIRVFYIDCLFHKIETLNDMIRQLSLNITDEDKKNVIFIIENLHVLERETLKKFADCKEKFTLVCTSRLFTTTDNDSSELDLKFLKENTFSIGDDKESFKKVIEGILAKNGVNANNISKICAANLENLWIYGMILRIIGSKNKNAGNISFYDILSDTKAFGEEISHYLEELLKSKYLSKSSSEKADIINTTRYVLGILSIFSRDEIWCNQDFIERLVDEAPINTPIGQMIDAANITNNNLTKVESLLMDIKELGSRTVDLNAFVKKMEYRIPHAQIAVIYYNCLLSLTEEAYPGTTRQIFQEYIIRGEYFGTFLTRHIRYYYQQGAERSKLHSLIIDALDDLNEQSTKGVFSITTALTNQFKDRSVKEIYNFLECFEYDSLKNHPIKRIIEAILNDQSLVNDKKWIDHLSYADSTDVLWLLKYLNRYMTPETFLKYVKNSGEHFIEKISTLNNENLLHLATFFLEYSIDEWKDIFGSIQNNLAALSKEEYSNNHLLFLYDDSKGASKNDIFLSLVDNVCDKTVKECPLDLLSTIIYHADQGFGNSIYNQRICPYLHYYLFNAQFHDHLQERMKKAKLQDTSNLIGAIINYLSQKKGLDLLRDNLDIIISKMNEASLTERLGVVDHTFNNFLKGYRNKRRTIASNFVKDWNQFKSWFISEKLDDIFKIWDTLHYFFQDCLPELMIKCINLVKQMIMDLIRMHWDDGEAIPIFMNVFDKFSYDKNLIEVHLPLFQEYIDHLLEVSNKKPFLELFVKVGKSSLRFQRHWPLARLFDNEKFEKLISTADIGYLNDLIQALYGYSRETIDDFKSKYHDILKQKYPSLDLDDLNLKEIAIQLLHDGKLEEFFQLINSYLLDIYFGHKTDIKDIITSLADYFCDESFIKQLDAVKFEYTINLIMILYRIDKSILDVFLTKNQEWLGKKVENENLETVISVMVDFLVWFNEDDAFLSYIDDSISAKRKYRTIINEWLDQLDLASWKFILSLNLQFFNGMFHNQNLEMMIEQSSFLQFVISIFRQYLILIKKSWKWRIGLLSGSTAKEYDIDEESFNFLTKHIKIFMEFMEFKKHNENNKDWINNVLEFKNIDYIDDQELFALILKQSFINTNICTASLVDLTIFFDALHFLEAESRNVIQGLLDDIRPFLLSDNLSAVFQSSNFVQLSAFFKALNAVDEDLTKDVWLHNSSILIDEKLVMKQTPIWISEIILFYSFSSDQPNYINEIARSVFIKWLKACEPLILLNEIIKLDLQTFKTILNDFQLEIREIVDKLSREEAQNIIHDLKHRSESKKRNAQENQEYGEKIKIFLPFVKKKLNEKYIFDS